MDNDFYENLDTNFAQALEMSEKTFTHDELMDMLKSGNIPQKQIAAMKIDSINNSDEAEIFINNLTGCDGKIREAIAQKLLWFLSNKPNYSDYFLNSYTRVAQSTIDINGNICRYAIESAKILKKDKSFSNKYVERLLEYIKESFIGLDKIVYRDKKYTVNKQLFKLYWCLEGIKNFTDYIDKEILLNILERASKEKEYTIREKTAQILVLLDDDIYSELKNNLRNDENYYVRVVFNIS